MGESRNPSSIQEPRRADAGLIEQELTALWKEAEQTDRLEGSAPVIRACSANLLIVFSGHVDTVGIDALLDAVANVHPARTFLIAVDGQLSERTLETFVSARCSIPMPGEKQVCCEQINLHASPDAFRKIHSVITSLIVPDVPVVLFWKTGFKRGDDLLDGLREISDLIVLDPPDDKRFPLKQVEVVSRIRKSSRVPVGHLSWERIQPWQILIAASFEEAALRERMKLLQEITVEYSDGSDSTSALTASLFLIGWLARSLELQKKIPLRAIEGLIGGSALMGEKEIRLSLKGLERLKGGEDGLQRIIFRGREEILILQRVEGQRCIKAEQPGEGSDKIFPVSLEDDAQLLIRQMNMAGGSPGFSLSSDALLSLVDPINDDEYSDC